MFVEFFGWRKSRALIIASSTFPKVKILIKLNEPEGYKFQWKITEISLLPNFPAKGVYLYMGGGKKQNAVVPSKWLLNGYIKKRGGGGQFLLQPFIC